MIAEGTSVGSMIAGLDRWLDSMRSPAGYAGPVVHWWQDCLGFCGAGLDWRYEGIIIGYLTLFSRTGQRRWLDKAQRAGDDLVRGQLSDGRFRNSGFELNPLCGGTPHEAAADLALLHLASASRDAGDPDWERVLAVARKNLEEYHLGQLWNESERRFSDRPGQPSFVPNKVATLVEALCLLADLTGRDEYLERYVRPSVDAIVALQRKKTGDRLDGAIAQNILGRQTVEKFFPYYVARCVPGLIAAGKHLDDGRYIGAALQAMTFVLRWRDPDGGLPQVIYRDGRVNRFPRWIAALGDVLRAAEIVAPYGLTFPAEPTLSWILRGQLPSGAFATAQGFASYVSQRERGPVSDARDVLAVVGWNDKTFRYLATRAEAIPHSSPGPDALQFCSEVACRWRGRPGVLHDDAEELWISVRNGPGRSAYSWRKGTTWARLREL